MAKKQKLSENARISAAALRLAEGGWGKVTLDAVAKAAKIQPALLKKRFAALHKLAPLIAEEIDREAFADFKPAGKAHDILFDLLMARFDILQKHRAAILAMADAARRDRALSCALGEATLDGVYRIIKAAELKQPQRPLLALGLAGIYSWAFIAWRSDKSADMGKTMAALDRGLHWADKGAAFLTQYF